MPLPPSRLRDDAMRTPIVQLQQFIQAIRDAGYRGTGSAVAELVDNAFEAEAKHVAIDVRPDPQDADERVVIVSDDGTGMTPEVLELALQFGGSSRFGQRAGTGRFGMGLPNSSVSQAKRLEVYTWTKRHAVWWSYLDVDEIREGTLRTIPRPIRRDLPEGMMDAATKSGTVVVWRKCDRLSLKRESALVRRLKREVGRTFRRMLWAGKSVRLNGEAVKPVDPLFLRPGDNLTGAAMYGDVLEYVLRDDGGYGRSGRKVLARFVELPVSDWVSLSNAEKQAHGISKCAGVSILRAGREIDFGWYFMGNKRKENYDDWWRCEIEFPPELDELFGVTHTKQGIAPSEHITQLLTPDFEGIAHKLNARVRSTFLKVKGEKILSSEKRAGECDKLFQPPKRVSPETQPRKRGKVVAGNGGLRFKLSTKAIPGPEFFLPEMTGSELRLILNGQHPFFERFYRTLGVGGRCDARAVAKSVELLLFAAARAEVGTDSLRGRKAIAEFRRAWSDLVAAYLA